MTRKIQSEGNRHNFAMPYLTAEMSAILSDIEKNSDEDQVSKCIYFSPTALTHIKRLIETGGIIITDTNLLASGVDETLLGTKGARVQCFIDDPQVIDIAEHRRITRAEIAVDYALSQEGLKLMVVGSAPSAINRILKRRAHEPMSDVCVLAAPTGFASVVQLKEKLVDSDLASIVIRGKKGGIPLTISTLNAILREITKPVR